MPESSRHRSQGSDVALSFDPSAAKDRRRQRNTRVAHAPRRIAQAGNTGRTRAQPLQTGGRGRSVAKPFAGQSGSKGGRFLNRNETTESRSLPRTRLIEFVAVAGCFRVARFLAKLGQPLDQRGQFSFRILVTLTQSLNQMVERLLVGRVLVQGPPRLLDRALHLP